MGVFPEAAKVARKVKPACANGGLYASVPLLPDSAFMLIFGFLRNGSHNDFTVSAKQIYPSAFRAELSTRG